ncbi:MAG: LysE family transporter [Thermoproteota archaeon]
MFDLLFQMGVGFFIAISGVLIPGPLLAFVAVKTFDTGPRTGLMAALGHILVELGILSLVALGLTTFLKRPIFMQGIGVIGGILLLGLGVLMLLKSRSEFSKYESVSQFSYHPFTGGVLFSTILNPAVFLWWMTVGVSTLVGSVTESGLLGGTFWIIGHFLADIVWYTFISVSLDKGRNIIDTGFYRGLLVACGVTLLILGIRFVARYLPSLIDLL